MRSVGAFVRDDADRDVVRFGTFHERGELRPGGGTIADPGAQGRLVDHQLVRNGETLSRHPAANAPFEFFRGEFGDSGGEDGPSAVLRLQQARYVENGDIAPERGVVVR